MRTDPETVEAEFLLSVAPPAAVALGLAAEPEPVAAAPPGALVAAPEVAVAPPALPPETILPVAPGFWPEAPVGAKVPGLPAASVMVKRVDQALLPALL